MKTDGMFSIINPSVTLEIEWHCG